MGLGKTVQAIALAACYRDEWPALVVAPSALREQWADALHRWLGVTEGRCHIVHSGKDAAAVPPNIDFLIVSYNFLDKMVRRARRRPPPRAAPAGRALLAAVGCVPRASCASLCLGHCAISPRCVSPPAPPRPLGLVSLALAALPASPPLPSPPHLPPAAAPQDLAGRYRVVIVDESHYLKDSQAKRTKAALPLLKAAARCLLLTGTPALNRPKEVYTQLAALVPAAKLKLKDFGERYCSGSRFDRYAGSANLEELHAMLRGSVMVRRLKAEVLSQLPKKRRQQVFLSLDAAARRELGALQGALDAVKAALAAALAQSAASGGAVCAGGGRMEESKAIMEMYRRTAELKAKAVQDYVEVLLDGGQKFLVFAHHTALMDAIEHVCNRRAGCRCVRARWCLGSGCVGVGGGSGLRGTLGASRAACGAETRSDGPRRCRGVGRASGARAPEGGGGGWLPAARPATSHSAHPRRPPAAGSSASTARRPPATAAAWSTPSSRMTTCRWPSCRSGRRGWGSP
jgi:hypothetical protein